MRRPLIDARRPPLVGLLLVAACLVTGAAIAFLATTRTRTDVNLAWPDSLPRLSRITTVGLGELAVRVVATELDVLGGGTGVRLSLSLDDGACQQLSQALGGSCDGGFSASHVVVTSSHLASFDALDTSTASTRLRIASGNGSTLEWLGFWKGAGTDDASKAPIELSADYGADDEVTIVADDARVSMQPSRPRRRVLLTIPAYYYGYNPHRPDQPEVDDFEVRGLEYIDLASVWGGVLEITAPGLLATVGTEQRWLGAGDRLTVVADDAGIGVTLDGGEGHVVTGSMTASSIRLNETDLTPTVGDSSPLLIPLLMMVLGVFMGALLDRTLTATIALLGVRLRTQTRKQRSPPSTSTEVHGVATPTPVDAAPRAASDEAQGVSEPEEDGARRRGTPVPVEAIRNKTPGEVRAAVNGFAVRYVKDWDTWLAADRDARPELFGRTLRKWQAIRPKAMRRLRAEAQHGAPFLDDLLESATDPLLALGDLTVLTIAQRTPQQDQALTALWDIFSRLPTAGLASCVGITKAVLLLTDGRIGPAFDSKVRAKLGVGRRATCRDWLQILQGIGEDIAMFESTHGPLAKAVPSRFAHLAYGRLYDMALGPR